MNERQARDYSMGISYSQVTKMGPRGTRKSDTISVVLTKIRMFHSPAWAEGSYSTGLPAGGTHQI